MNDVDALERQDGATAKYPERIWFHERAFYHPEPPTNCEASEGKYYVPDDSLDSLRSQNAVLREALENLLGDLYLVDLGEITSEVLDKGSRQAAIKTLQALEGKQ